MWLVTCNYITGTVDGGVEQMFSCICTSVYTGLDV